MEYKIVLILLVLGVAIFSGCVTEGKTEYYSKKYNETITLYPDKTVTAINPSSSSSGTYRIDDNYLIITYQPFGNVVKLKIEGKRLIDETDGDYWEKI
jgi:hypothetical protein